MTEADRPGAFDPEAPLPGAPDPWQGSSIPALRPGPPWAMTEMIAAEPAFAERLLRRLAAPDGAAARLAAALLEAATADTPIRIVGCGTSEHGAQATALILAAVLAHEGFAPRVEAVQAFEAALAPQRGGLVVGISHEGGTWATNRALEAARAAGSRAALVTVSDRSPAAALADIVLTTEEADQSWCHTVGYLSPVLAALAVAGHVTGKAPDAAAVRSALAAGAGGADAAERVAARLADASHIVVAASGADRPAARELALKIEEATWLPSTMRDLETFLHGHVPAADATTGLVLILADTDALEARAERAAEALAAAHAIGLRTTAILSDAAHAALLHAPTPAGRMRAVMPVGLEGPAAALVATAVPLQLLTERLARARGTNPDPIRRDQAAYLEAAARVR